VNEADSEPNANALAVRGHRLYVGGRFVRAGRHRRHNLMAFDTRTGRVTRWRADANGEVWALVIHRHTLYVAGGFTRVDGHRRRGLAAIDLRSGRLTAWKPRTEKPLYARANSLAVANGRVYLGGGFGHVDGRRRGHLAAVDLSKGKLLPWHPRANHAVSALAVIADTLYAAGEFTSISRAPRNYLAAINGRSGAPTDWQPGPDFQPSALLATPAGLVAAGDFEPVDGSSSDGLDFFPAAP
jgi:outer membrane protein assembly factor BamB